MKKLCVLLLCAASFAACRSSNGPQTGGAATMPNLGSEFTYQVVSHTGQVLEQTTISSVSNDTFTVTRKSDTVNGFCTNDMEKYTILTSGDLLPPIILQCDTFPLPIESHRTFTPPPSKGIPTKLNGYVDPNSSVTIQAQYEGEVTINAAGTNFLCSQVSETLTVMAESGQVGGGVDTQSVTHRYWYSPEIGFFVKDEELSQTSDSTANFTRTLVSYKLAK